MFGVAMATIGINNAFGTTGQWANLLGAPSLCVPPGWTPANLVTSYLGTQYKMIHVKSIYCALSYTTNILIKSCL